jgi:hypothetical protein
MVHMSAVRRTSNAEVVIPKKPVREKLATPIGALFGCLKNLPRNPLADLEAEHQAEIDADKPGAAES